MHHHIRVLGVALAVCVLVFVERAGGQESVRPSQSGLTATELRKPVATPQNYNLKLGPVIFDASAGVGFEYTDNVGISERDRKSDFSIRPQLNMGLYWQATRYNTLRLTVGFAFTGAVVGEFIASSRGLGYLLNFAQNSQNASLMLANVILILLIILALNVAVQALAERVSPSTARAARRPVACNRVLGAFAPSCRVPVCALKIPSQENRKCQQNRSPGDKGARGDGGISGETNNAQERENRVGYE